jgi:hypothetical protein
MDEHKFWPAGLYGNDPFEMNEGKIPAIHVVSDGGRAQSKRPKANNDCSVRAVAIAFNIPYDEAYDQLAAAGRKCGYGVKKLDWRAFMLARATWQAFQAVKGQPRMNAVTFCKQYPTGRYILSFAGHLAAVVDGQVHDVHGFEANRCVYGAYTI